MTASVADPRRSRLRTDVRFGILVAAVLATGMFAFSAVAVASPEAGRLDAQVVQPCVDAIDGQTAAIRDPDERSTVQVELLNVCFRPFLRAQVKWVLGGLVAVLVLTAGLYLLHPWWLGRRRRMTPLRPADPEVAEVVEELDRLARQSGLSKPPSWWVAPYATGHGGQAFGLPGRYRVGLDVGLLVLYEVDRDGFRTVVQHELAHLRNRDVGRTYLTVALWWSFVAVALSPFVAVSLNPGLLSNLPDGVAEPAEITYRLVALGALTVVGYLVRNAILRARELCADSTAAQRPSTGAALARVLSALPWPPRHRRWRQPEWLARLGPHPDPAVRIEAVAAGNRLTATSWWELTGLGFMAGLALNNVSLLIGNLLERYVTVGLLLLALPVGGVVAALLVGAFGQAGRRRRDIVTLPVGLAAGFALSGALNLMVAGNTSLTPLAEGPAAFVVSLLALAVPMVLLAAWAHSVCRHLERPAAHRIVTGTGVAVAAPLIAVWYTLTYGSNKFTGLHPTTAPQTGLTLDWYRGLGRWLHATITYLPVFRLWMTPFVPLAVVLLWVVPVLLCGRWRHGVAGPRIGVRGAVRTGLVAGMSTVAVAVALPLLARTAVPADVRRTVEGAAGLSFSVNHGLVFIVVAGLAQAVAAAVVAATSARLRPVLVALAVTVTAVGAAAGYNLTKTVADCIGLDGAFQSSCRPEIPGPGSQTVFYLPLIFLAGAVAGTPAALAGAGLGAWRRRRHRFARRFVRQPARWEAAAGLGLLAALVPAAAASAVPDQMRIWMPVPPSSVPAALPPPSSGGAAACLVGEWLATSQVTHRRVDGKRLRFAGRGQIMRFRPDGTAEFDDGSGVTVRATSGGRRYDLTTTGSITASYRVEGVTIAYSGGEAKRPKTFALRIDGRTVDSGRAPAGTVDDRFRCTGDRLQLFPAAPDRAGDYRIDLVRR